MEKGKTSTVPVYFIDIRTPRGSSLLVKTQKLFLSAGLDKCIGKDDLVAVKVHWGEMGNLAYLAPPLVRSVVDMIKDCGGKPFITDSNTLYRGRRRNAVDNILTAYHNGFTQETVGAPIVVADGLKGMDYVNVTGNGPHFKSMKIASAIHYADAMIVLTHVKGHMLVGFGGTIKNLSMGCASPAGKQALHSDLRPRVKRKVCIDVSFFTGRVRPGSQMKNES